MHERISSFTPIYLVLCNLLIHLNNILGTNYKLISKETTKLINEKLNEGFTLENFIKVIDKKHNQWRETEMAKYLRPKTLFGDNFELYLNEIIVHKKRERNKSKE